MSIRMIVSSVSTLLFLSACAPINTQFSCNATASDRCLSIEEVDAMTQSDSTNTSKQQSTLYRWKPSDMKADNTQYKTRLASKTQTIWMAPWTDATGQLHENDTLFANANRSTKVS